ncbi:hypothetical protein RNJ44_00635 [Nakaseomyces bracarensis]|uniref:Uncharacterized protein n=1 Tax=Nakaseomyces bracarensis TaxID=273131 RepID=A0ABR4NRM9_9SACH
MSIISESLNMSLDSPDIASAVSLYGNVSSSRLNLTEDADLDGEFFDPTYSTDNLSTVAMYEMDPGSLDDPKHRTLFIEREGISRTPSRNSTNSVVATKDGIEGRHIRKNKIAGRSKLGNGLVMSPYSVNLLSTIGNEKNDDVSSNEQTNDTGFVPKCHSPLAYLDSQQHQQNDQKLIYPDSPDDPPMSLKEKMHLLSHDYVANSAEKSRLMELEKQGNNHSIDSFTSDTSELESNTSRLRTYHSANSQEINHRFSSDLNIPVDRYDVNSCESTLDDKSIYTDTFAGLPTPTFD